MLKYQYTDNYHFLGRKLVIKTKISIEYWVLNPEFFPSRNSPGYSPAAIPPNIVTAIKPVQRTVFPKKLVLPI
jgi:hypothetical protein